LFSRVLTLYCIFYVICMTRIAPYRGVRFGQEEHWTSKIWLSPFATVRLQSARMLVCKSVSRKSGGWFIWNLEFLTDATLTVSLFCENVLLNTFCPPPMVEPVSIQICHTLSRHGRSVLSMWM